MKQTIYNIQHTESSLKCVQHDATGKCKAVLLICFTGFGGCDNGTTEHHRVYPVQPYS